MREMKLQDLKSKTPAELVQFAEENKVENASTMRKQELMFAILKQLAIQETDIIGEGVVEVRSDRAGGARVRERVTRGAVREEERLALARVARGDPLDGATARCGDRSEQNCSESEKSACVQGLLGIRGSAGRHH